MGRILKNKQAVDHGELDPRRFSRCHSRQYSFGDILVIRPDFTEEMIGLAAYCEHTDYSDGVRACFKLHETIVRFKNWPSGLSEHTVRNLIDRQGTTYWLSSGFHILYHLGQWESMKKYSIIPPFDQNRPGLSDTVLKHLKAVKADKTQGRAVFGADRAIREDSGDIPFEGQEDAF